MVPQPLVLWHARRLPVEPSVLVEPIAEAFPGLEVGGLHPRDPPASVREPGRGQLDADRLLAGLPGEEVGWTLWVVGEDLFAEDLAFVFGKARAGVGAVLSTHRLTSRSLVVKEAIHEVGHVVGLGHCDRSCVMAFSNSLIEAQAKPAELCQACRDEVGERLG